MVLSSLNKNTGMAIGNIMSFLTDRLFKTARSLHATAGQPFPICKNSSITISEYSGRNSRLLYQCPTYCNNDHVNLYNHHYVCYNQCHNS